MTARVLHLVSCDLPAPRTAAVYLALELIDEATGKRYRAAGGAYDTPGAVFGAWLWDLYAAELTRIAPERAWRHKVGKFAYQYFGMDPYHPTPSDALGNRLLALTWNATNNSASLYMGCGRDEMFKVAEALGLEVSMRTLPDSPLVVAILVHERAKDTQP